jgi:subtilisin family serine protease
MQVSSRFRTDAYSSGLAVGAILFFCVVATLIATAPKALAAPASDQYIVVLKEHVAHSANVAHRHEENRGAELGHIYGDSIEGYSAELTLSELKAIKQDPNVDYVERDSVLHADSQAPSTGFNRVFAPSNPIIDIDEVDDVRSDVDVAIIDTGVALHPDLNVVTRTSCLAASVCAEKEVEDGYGHGTHVAGIVGALDNNFGTVGTAPGARIWSVKAGNQKGEFDMSDVIAAVNWVTARSNQIEVVNMSLGCEGYIGGDACEATAMRDAIAASVDKGVVYVVSAGNVGLNVEHKKPVAPFGSPGFVPAAFPDVITVSALADFDGVPGGTAGTAAPCDYPYRETKEGNVVLLVDEDDTLADFSNWGPPVDIAAPGTCIWSTVPGGGYGVKSGTSMAAPMVTGAVANVAAANNPNSRADVEGIRNFVRSLGNYNWTDQHKQFTSTSVSMVGDAEKEPLLDMSIPVPPKPTVTTEPATEIGQTTVKLSGWVNPNGASTHYYFQYGKTTSYGSTSPAPPGDDLGSGSDQRYGWTIATGLTAETTYHFRIVASSPNGTSYGADAAFTTAKKPANPRVFFAGTSDAGIHELAYGSGTPWGESIALSATVAAGTSPTSFINTNGLKRAYFVSSTDKKIHEIAYNGTSWAETGALTQEVAPGSSPSAFAWPSGGVRLYYVAKADNKIHELAYTSGAWADSAGLTGTVAAGSSPSAFLNQAGQPRVYYVGATDNKIYGLFYTGTWGINAALTQAVATGTSPSAIMAPDGWPRVYYSANSDKKIHELSYNATTGWADGAALTGTMAAGTSPKATQLADGRVLTYYVGGADNKIHELSYAAGVWTDSAGLTGTVAAKSSPSVVWINGNMPRIFFVGSADSKIHEFAYTGTGVTGWAERSGVTGAVAAETSPSAFVFNGSPVVYAVNKADNKIHELSFTAGYFWSESGALTGAVAAGSSPTSYMYGDNQTRIFFVSAADNKVHELAYNGTNWAAPSAALTGEVATGTSPSAFLWPFGGVRLYYVGKADKKIHELSYNTGPGGGWADSAAMTGTVAAGSSPSAFMNKAGMPRVYYVGGTDNKVHELSYTGTGSTGWADSAGMTGTVATGTSPSAFINGSGMPRVYYVSTDTKVHELSYTGSGATGWADSAALTQAVATGSSPSAIDWPGGGVRLYYAAKGDNKIHQLSYNAGSWADSAALTGTVATGTSPSAFEWPVGGVRVYYVGTDTRIHELSYNMGVGWADSGALTGAAAAGSSPSAFRMLG